MFISYKNWFSLPIVRTQFLYVSNSWRKELVCHQKSKEIFFRYNIRLSTRKQQFATNTRIVTGKDYILYFTNNFTIVPISYQKTFVLKLWNVNSTMASADSAGNLLQKDTYWPSHHTRPQEQTPSPPLNKVSFFCGGIPASIDEIPPFRFKMHVLQWSSFEMCPHH